MNQETATQEAAAGTTAKTRKENDQYIESLCNKIYAVATAHDIPVILMHKDNIYAQDDAVGTNRLMLEHLDKALNN